MKRRWFNFLRFLLSILFLVGTFFITSCDSDDDDKKIVCRPSTVKSSYTIEEETEEGTFEEVTHTGVQEYVYNAENKIETLFVHGDDDEEAKAILEYNEKGLLVKVLITDVSSPEGTSIFELIYNDHDKPQEVREWGPDDDLSGPPYSVQTFSHDGSNRLVKSEISYSISSLRYFQRYEYDNHDNVTKMFLGYGAMESLYLENLSFDTKSTYYSLVPGLETLYVYVFRRLPGKNNPLTAKIHPGGTHAPIDVTYNVTYDENGRIISYHASTLKEEDNDLILGGNPDFDEVTYDCEL